MFRRTLLLLAMLAGVSALAQTPYNTWQSSGSMAYVPSASTALTSTSAYVAELHLSDPSGQAVTVTVSDSNGAVWTIPLGGNNPSIIYWPFPNGIRFSGGVAWYASTPNVVKGHMGGTY